MLAKLTGKKKDKNNEAVSEEVIKQKREKTAQQWMPIIDINGPIAVRKDNTLLTALRIEPQAIHLLSDNEKKRKIAALAEELNGEIEEYEFFCIGRPVDLTIYLDWLQEKAKVEQHFIRKQVLRGFIQSASNKAASGEVTERRFYLILTKKNGNRAQEELMNRLTEFKNKLSQAELETKICYDDELLDVNSLFANPAYAAFEKNINEISFAPILAY